VYRSPADALSRLLEDERGYTGLKITRMKQDIVQLANGIKYFAVEVTAEDGVQYGISAYDEEAEELYTLANTKSSSQVSASVPCQPGIS